ncbi:MAG: class II aldolase/adducin family protein [Litorilinea sp.]
MSNTTTGQEGVIKFHLDYTPSAPLDASLLGDLMDWREILFTRQLIGQDPARYAGYGFGNISLRLPTAMATLAGTPGPDRPTDQPIFAISGTQTGHLSPLTVEYYAVVIACYPTQNRIVARGPIRPSSESMTHGILYALDANIGAVMHAHSPEIWQAAPALRLPTTAATVPYGTPAMAQEVVRLFAETDCGARGIFSMGGHEDGIVSFGPTLADAGRVLLAAQTAATASY